MVQKTCCVTGHRDIPAEKLAFVRARLGEEIKAAIQDGYATFLSGFADGADLLFAELVLEWRALYPQLCLEAAIPYRNRLDAANPVFQSCLAACSNVYVEQEEYSSHCFMNRNRYLVKRSARVLAVYDGRERGGTSYTISYARAMNREVREIRI